MPFNCRVATKATKLAELEADRTRIRTALAAAQTASGTAGFSVDGISQNSGSGANIKALREDLIAVEKSIQRLLRGGRGIVVDLSAGVPGDPGDPYRSGGEVLL
jgi:hypothetical protein